MPHFDVSNFWGPSSLVLFVGETVALAGGMRPVKGVEVYLREEDSLSGRDPGGVEYLRFKFVLGVVICGQPHWVLTSMPSKSTYKSRFVPICMFSEYCLDPASHADGGVERKCRGL